MHRPFESPAPDQVAILRRQGRILVDSRLRTHAAIELQTPVMVLGALDRIELWEPGRYEQQEAVGLQELNETSSPSNDRTTPQSNEVQS